MSEVMGIMIEEILTSSVLPNLVKEDLLTLVRAEASELKPHFEKLNQGSNGSSEVTKLKGAAYYTGGTGRAGDEELELAATSVHAWLGKKDSKLRAFMAGMSTGGIFFVAQCHEKAARGFVLHGGGCLQAMKAAAVASAKVKVSTCDDAAGLGGG